MKCTVCNAPVDYNQKGHLKFDSSQYHMDAVKKLSEIGALKGYIEDLEDVIDAVRAMELPYLGYEYGQFRLNQALGRVTESVSEKA